MPPIKLFGCLKNLDLSSTANGQYLADDILDVIESNIMLQHLNLSNCRLSELRLMKITKCSEAINVEVLGYFFAMK